MPEIPVDLTFNAENALRTGVNERLLQPNVEAMGQGLLLYNQLTQCNYEKAFCCGILNWSPSLPLMGVSENSGTPKWMVKIMENPIKIDDLGENPLF